MTNPIFEEVRKFELKLGLPRDFYNNLREEDDWSFVIKLAALFEGATTHVLTTRLHAPKLVDAFANLDQLNVSFGKVALLRKLEAITADQCTFLRKLGELRNELAHNISCANFSFSTYVAASNKTQLQNIVKVFGYGLSEAIEIQDKKVSREKFVSQNLKLAIWLTAAEVLACLYLEFEVADLHLKNLGLAQFVKLSDGARGQTPEPSVRT